MQRPLPDLFVESRIRNIHRKVINQNSRIHAIDGFAAYIIDNGESKGMDGTMPSRVILADDRFFGLRYRLYNNANTDVVAGALFNDGRMLKFNYSILHSQTTKLYDIGDFRFVRNIAGQLFCQRSPKSAEPCHAANMAVFLRPVNSWMPFVTAACMATVDCFWSKR